MKPCDVKKGERITRHKEYLYSHINTMDYIDSKHMNSEKFRTLSEVYSNALDHLCVMYLRASLK